MDPSKTQDDPSRGLDRSATGDNTVDHAMGRHQLAHSLSRLTLGQAASIPLPTSPPLPTHNETSSPPLLPQQPASSRMPSSDLFGDERLKLLPTFELRQPTLPLRTPPANNPFSFSGDSSRRSSANFVGSPIFAPSPAMNPPAEGPTAASIAAEHFRKEVDLHKTGDLGCTTVVLIHDDCYGHRFARRTTKPQLQAIVERPERIRACLGGIASAYVRLGRRHEGGEFAPRPDVDLNSLPVPFNIVKTSNTLSLTDRAVTDVHGTEWMNELQSMCDLAESRLVEEQNELERSTTQDSAFSAPGLSVGDLYLCSESAKAFQGALGAVCDGVDRVFGPGPTTRAFVCIRPPGHHCSDDLPSGFCWVNNVQVGISHAATQHGLTHAAIIDFDLHHGDGSQDIAYKHNFGVNEYHMRNKEYHDLLKQKHNDMFNRKLNKRIKESYDALDKYSAYEKAPIGYFSLHDLNSFPCEDGAPDKLIKASVCMGDSYWQSIWNIHLEKWKAYDHFWRLYRHKYMALLARARAFMETHNKRLAETPGGPTPKAAIFISAGFDANEHEDENMQRHGINVMTEFYAQFTRDVVQLSQLQGLGVDGRVISVLEGGYSDRALTSGVLSHLAGLTALSPEPVEQAPSDADEKPEPANNGWDPDWWSAENMQEFEELVAPRVKPRGKSARTFSKPTQSSSARMAAPRSNMAFGSAQDLEPALTPPPDVGWATAAHELSKVLIPESGQSTSHAPQELNALATRERRERFLQQAGLVSTMDLDNDPPLQIRNRRRLHIQKSGSRPVYSPRPATAPKKASRKSPRKTVEAKNLPAGSREHSPSADASRRKSGSGVV